MDITPRLRRIRRTKRNPFSRRKRLQDTTANRNPIYSAAEGYVSRVRVQIGGGGNSVYVDHPNGYTSVYLHMDSFNDQLSEIVKAEQYKKKSFDVDIDLPRNKVVMKKGQLLGIKTIGSGTYGLAGGAPIPVNGKFGLGINTIDRHSGTNFSFGVYSIELLLDDAPSKAIIVDERGRSKGGRYENGWVVTSLRDMGSYYIAVDTVAPVITARNLTNGKNLANQSKIDFTISDNLSGIQTFNAYIDDKWVLMEYDPKNRHVWHTFEPSLSKGNKAPDFSAETKAEKSSSFGFQREESHFILLPKRQYCLVVQQKLQLQG
ncbi:hypothetical protein FQR65_LT18454 [Abscondita terminalis]|nr:hypothetical protein FQR65_LT18454 [Abscondita terminalis]